MSNYLPFEDVISDCVRTIGITIFIIFMISLFAAVYGGYSYGYKKGQQDQLKYTGEQIEILKGQ